MAEDIGVEEILTPTEVAAIQAAQDLYGAEAKLAAGELAVTLDINDQAREQLVGGVALHLEGLNFEERRQVALGFRDLACKLGGKAVRGEPNHGTPHLVPPLDGRHEVRTVQSAPLTDRQREWFSRLLGEENVGLVAELPMHPRLEFAANLGEMYQGLAINRLSPADKERRAQQMTAFIGGKSLEEIAADTQSSVEALRLGLKKMTDSIRLRKPLEDILGLLPSLEAKPQTDTDNSDEQSLEEELSPGGVQPLSKAQRRWYEKVFAGVKDPDLLESLEGLRYEQQEYLAERLARYLRSYVIRREGPVKTDRRIRIMTLFLAGTEAEQIAQTVGLPETHIKQQLHASALMLQRRSFPKNLANILQDTRDLELATDYGQAAD